MNKSLMLFASLAASISVASASTTLARPSVATQTDQAFVYHGENFFCKTQLNGSLFLRTELVFGLSRSSGPDVTEAEFQSFIDDQVTPRFPDGLTLLSGNGQFKDSSGVIVQEKSKLLVLLYPFSRDNSALVEEIRAEYKAMFQQQSVLRVDEEMCTSF